MNAIREIYYVAGAGSKLNLLGLYASLDRFLEEENNEFRRTVLTSAHGYGRGQTGNLVETDDLSAPLIEDTIEWTDFERIIRAGGYVRLGAKAKALIDRSLRENKKRRVPRGA